MIKKMLLTTTAVMLTIGTSVSVNASSVADKIARSTLVSVNSSINTAVDEASALFGVNAGQSITAYPIITSVVTMINGTPTTSADNPHLKHLTINTDYEIEIMFHEVAQDKITDTITSTTSGSSQDTRGLRNAKILLSPNYTSNSAIITSWDCFTDADGYRVNDIMSSAAPTDGARSFIADLTSNPLINLCTYTTADLFADPS